MEKVSSEGSYEHLRVVGGIAVDIGRFSFLLWENLSVVTFFGSSFFLMLLWYRIGRGMIPLPKFVDILTRKNQIDSFESYSVLTKASMRSSAWVMCLME